MPNKDSLVWKYYKSVHVDGTRYGQCFFCDKKFVAHAFRMRKHLIKCIKCPANIKNKFEEISGNTKNIECNVNLPSTSNKVKKGQGSIKRVKLENFVDKMTDSENTNINVLMARAFFSSSISFRTIEDEYFLAALKALRPAYTLPSRWCLSRPLLNKEYARIETYVKYKINNADSICIQTDGWTDISGNDLINIVLTTPSPIFFKAIDPKTNQHTASYIESLLSSVIDEIGSEKVHALVTDNASNMKATWELLNRKYPNLNTYGCAAHGLNLVAKDIVTKIKSVQELTKTAKKIVQYFKHKHLPRKILKEIQIEKTGKEICLHFPIETRWGSMATCLKSLLVSKEYLELAVLNGRISQDAENYGVREAILSERNFWQILKQCFSILDGISISIKCLEGEKSTMEKVFPTIKNLAQDLVNNLKFFNEEEQLELTNIFKKRQDMIINDCHLATHLLDPKQQGKLLNEKEKQKAISLITRVGSIMEIKNIIVDLAEYIAKENFYKNDILWQSTEQLDSIVWWKGLCSERPLATLAARILNFPATTCCSERNWKDFSLIKNKKRNRLSTETTIKLVFIKYNLRSASTDEIENCIKGVSNEAGKELGATSESTDNDNYELLYVNEGEEEESDDLGGTSYLESEDDTDNLDLNLNLTAENKEMGDISDYDATEVFIGTELADFEAEPVIIDNNSEYMYESEDLLVPVSHDSEKGITRDTEKVIKKFINLTGRNLEKL